MHTITPRGTPSRRGRSPRSQADSPLQAAGSSLLQPGKPSATFISSLHIPVEGAIPIDPDIPYGPTPSLVNDPSPQTPTPESKRAPRKSKTEALVALQSHAQSSSTGSEDFMQSDTTAGFSSIPTTIPVSPLLDLNSVKTSSPKVAPTRNQPRPFSLEDCPAFYPTVEEFKDPMAYVRSISDTAQDYGICKIIPPEGWKMPFMTDTASFRFKTRLQRLNSIEASSRAKINFLEQLYRWHKQQGNSRVAVPTINHKPLDLWLLRKEVDKLGGYEAVNRNKWWSDLGRILGYRGIPGLSNQLKNSYTRVILPYEDFCNRVRSSHSMSPANRSAQPKDNSHTQATERAPGPGASNMDDSSPPSSPLTAASSPLSEPPYDAESRDTNGTRGEGARRMTQGFFSPEKDSAVLSKSSTGPSLPGLSIPAPVFHDQKDAKGMPEQSCEICHRKNHGEKMLLCDGCDCGFHTYCLVPELLTIPKDQWFCHTCLFGTGGDYGFDEGEEHSLSSFQARDLAFRRMWFETHPPTQTNDSPSPDDMAVDDPFTNRFGDVLVTESDVENEFWRLVQSPHDTVEVEYGADVHSTTHGSAMPTLEAHPLNPYSRDPWNLNNIPVSPESLLRFIKSDISGMTVPWTYVGMIFSTFCWHNEDHYTYSMNYMHWGETKTWYGIPGEDAESFEAAIKREAPDLFEAQPDLLFQLVTLMNPKRVRDAGVRVYACNQRAGEFVVTFPKAYHAGFNHGLNLNEAVNFALPDWLPFGRDCVQRYREHRKLPVFSHDELLITITQQSQSISTAMWLFDSFKEMTDREMHDRRAARSLGLSEVLEEEDRRSEEQYQCAICKTFCYLSQVTCQCSTKVVCVEHAKLLCSHDLNHLTLRKRFSDEDLLATQTKVAERAAIPTVWKGKLEKALLESDRPPLRTLRALLSEGDRVNYPLPELQALRKCVNRANEWTESANAFIIRKQSRKRARRSRGKLPLNDAQAGSLDDVADKPERSLFDLYQLLREVQELGFDCPEIGALRAHAVQAENVRSKARAILDNFYADDDRDGFIQECERLLLDGSSLNVHLDELVELERIVLREQLIRELEEKLEDTSMTLDEVRQLLTRARACNMPNDHHYLKLLEARQRAGDNWEERANSILHQPYKTIDELSDFVNMDPSIPIDPAVLDHLKSALAKAKDFEKQAKAWLQSDSGKPRVQEVLKLVSRAEKDFSILAVQDLKRTADIAADLESRCDSVMKSRYTHTDEGADIFATMEKWRDYAREHLTMFSLPTFERFETQLDQHYRWVKELPWYCDQHQQAHGELILEDVAESTRPDDDLPPADEYFTCICTNAVRPPSPGKASDAVQCDHCFARFHGVCAANGGSCPFCDHHHWNGAIHKTRTWHFCFLPNILQSAPDVTKHYSEEWKQLEIIVHRLDRLSAVIGQFLSFASQTGNQRHDLIPQVRHYMRKLYRIQFAVSPNAEVSFGLDLAGLHRILAGQPTPIKSKKRRRPKFIFGQDVDKDWADKTRCICRARSSYLLGYPSVECDQCNKLYHSGCVFFPLDSSSTGNNRFTCPLCCLRKNRAYPYSDVRVQHIDRHEQNLFVNTKEMLDTFSREILYVKMLPPQKRTLFVELIRFVPGQPDNTPTNTSASRSSANTAHHSPIASPSRPRSVHASSAPPSISSPPPVSMVTSFGANGSGHASTSNHHIVPPPPWSRWGTVNTPLRPPATMRRHAPEATRPMSPSSARKRKHMDEALPPDDPSASSHSAKRRGIAPVPVGLPHIPQPPQRPVQTLSPSLAMMLSPGPESSPRPAPAVYNGPGSPVSARGNSPRSLVNLPPVL